MMDVRIVMGDLNAKIREESDGTTWTWKNKGGRREAGDVQWQERLGVWGSLFKHKDIHKITWNSPNARDQNQTTISTSMVGTEIR